MAEVLAVVASGISVGSLAIQIVGSVQQMLEIWSTIRDAPQNFRDLLEELKILGEILSECAEDCDGHTSTSPKASTLAVQHCQRAVSNIDIVLKDLTNGITSTKGRTRRWAAVKAAVKDKAMERSITRLERAKSLLMIARQSHAEQSLRSLGARFQILQDIQNDKLQRVEILYNPCQSSGHTFGTIMDKHDMTVPLPMVWSSRSDLVRQQARPPSKELSYRLALGTLFIRSKVVNTNGQKAEDTRSTEYNFRVRRWVSRRGYMLICTRIYGLWQYCFRSYRLFTWRDHIFAACALGDLKLVQRLCIEGQATPFDTTCGGWTLLHIAAAFARPMLCRWLIGQGVDSNASGALRESEQQLYDLLDGCDYEMSPLAVATTLAGRDYYPNEQSSIDCNRRLSERTINCLLVDNRSRPLDVLDTLRNLVEEGGSDPLVPDSGGFTALHRHTGTPEQFSYLLHQEHAHIDLGQRTRGGETVAEWHILYGCDNFLELTRLAYEREKLIYQRSNLSTPTEGPESSTTMLLHNASWSLPGFALETLPKFQQLTKLLINDGANIHGRLHNTFPILFRDDYHVTPLSQIPISALSQVSPGMSMEASRTNLDRVRDLSDQSFRIWIDTLREAGIDTIAYLKEEEELARQRKARGDWIQPIGSNEWWRIEWRFHYERYPESCCVSVSTEFEVEREEDDEVDRKGKATPGAWVKD